MSYRPTQEQILKYIETAPQPIKDVWNAAIEAAAQKVNKYLGEEPTNTYYMERAIRELKK